jgi:hypothetical protein
VVRAIRYGDQFYVEPVDSPGNWLKISPEGDGNVNISAGADMRYASVGGGDSPRWNVEFVDRQRVNADLKDAGYVAIENSPDPNSNAPVVVYNKGPPPPPPPGGGRVWSLADEPPERRTVLASLDGGDGAGGRGGRGKGNGGNEGDGGDFRRAAFDDGGGPESFAHKAALEPDRAVVFIAEAKKTGVARADALIKEGRFAEARDELDFLARIAPDDPEIRARLAIARAVDKSPLAAAEAGGAKLSKADLATVLEVADNAAPHLDPEAYARVDTIVRGLILKAAGDDVHFVGSSYEFGIELRLADAGRESAAAGAPEGGLRYVLDPNPVFVSSPMPTASESITGKLRNPAIEALHPDVVVDGKTGARWRLASSGIQTSPGRDGVARFRMRYQPLLNCPGLWNKGKDDRDRSPDCGQDVYTTGPDHAAAAPPHV